ncbi:MAG: penicillin-binding protein 2 [Candidatus Kapaibacterium sp.]|nr:penicillin-binding protein 2 [Ignavibacteriota bacterium]
MDNNYSDKFISKSRIRIFKVIVILICSLYTLKLAHLQIVKGLIYKEASEAQAIKQIIQEPFRGNIFDSKGKLIVHNKSSFALSFTPNLWREESFPLLVSLLDIDSTELRKSIEKYKEFSQFLPVKFQKDVDLETISGIEEYSEYLRGIDVLIESKRLYQSEAYMTHLLGYTKEISPKELELHQYYRPGDVIGKQGIEKEYEGLLKGSEGVKFVAVNKFGQQVFQYDNGKKDKISKNGFDLYLSVDSDLQAKAEKLLEGKRGAIVAINPSNGQVLAIASSPNYDLTEFSGKISAEYYNSILNDKDKPFLDRTVNSEYPPGSSWKMLIALAGLEEGIITKSSQLFCKGGYQYGNRFFKCLGHHGSINVETAIKKSCNAFFYQLSLKLGAENVINYGRKLNFGQITGIDLPSEKFGNFQDLSTMKKRFGNNIPGWMLMNFGIGQGEILVTPVQMASYIAAIANGGTWIQPHVVSKIYNHETRTFQNIEYSQRNLNLKSNSIEVVKEGMWQVVNSPGGTASNARINGIDVCGKTSTAQNPHGKDHGWFTCFAPKENPKIAMAVMVENAGWGGRVCAPIAKELLLDFFYPERNNIPTTKIDSLEIYEVNSFQDSTRNIVN